MQQLLWMNDMLDFICMDFADLWWTDSKRKIQNEWSWYGQVTENVFSLVIQAE